MRAHHHQDLKLSDPRLEHRRWPEFERLCDAAKARHLSVGLVAENGQLTTVVITRANRPYARRMMRFRMDDPSLSADLDATARALLELVAA
jgi:hypothetical protein